MTQIINKKTLENLEELARLKVKIEREEKMLKNLERILEHFGELKEVNTNKVLPMSGGTFSRNIIREDELVNDIFFGAETTSQFPERNKDFLRIPPVFE